MDGVSAVLGGALGLRFVAGWTDAAANVRRRGVSRWVVACVVKVVDVSNLVAICRFFCKESAFDGSTPTENVSVGVKDLRVFLDNEGKKCRPSLVVPSFSS